jgi:hypothetical protein
MVYNSQIYWVLELCPLSSDLKTIGHKVSENLFPSSGERENPTLLCLLERVQ